MTTDRLARADAVRHAMLELHKSLIDTQRIRYEREHGRVNTTSEFLGLVLEHPQFEWIRAFSALIAQLDEWREEPGQASHEELEGLLGAVRGLVQRDGPNEKFSTLYWEMAESTPEVFIGHVKLTRLLNSGNARTDPRPAG